MLILFRRTRRYAPLPWDRLRAQRSIYIIKEQLLLEKQLAYILTAYINTIERAHTKLFYF